MIELSNEELLARLRSDEDHFTERKTFKDRNGWLGTAVAFANSAPVDWPGILFIGVTRDGKFETPSPNLDELQRKDLGNEFARVFPLLYYLPRIVTDEAGQQCLAVLIPGISDRPHFTGKSYVRVGSESPEASESQFRQLIAQRQSKVYEILKWKDKTVTAENVHRAGLQNRRSVFVPTVLDCNEFYVTLGVPTPNSHPLRTIDLSFDHENDRLKIEIHR